MVAQNAVSDGGLAVEGAEIGPKDDVGIFLIDILNSGDNLRKGLGNFFNNLLNSENFWPAGHDNQHGFTAVVPPTDNQITN